MRAHPSIKWQEHVIRAAISCVDDVHLPFDVQVCPQNL